MVSSAPPAARPERRAARRPSRPGSAAAAAGNLHLAGMQQRVDPHRGHLAIAEQLGAAAFQVGQLNVGLKHVLLRGLVDLVLALGDLAELP